MAKDIIRTLVGHVDSKAITINGEKLKIDEVMSMVEGPHDFKDELAAIVKGVRPFIDDLQAVLGKIVQKNNAAQQDETSEKNMTRFRKPTSDKLTAKYGEERIIQYGRLVVENIRRVENRKEYKDTIIARSDSNLSNVKSTFTAMYMDILRVFALYCPYNLYNAEAKAVFTATANDLVSALVEKDQEELIMEYMATMLSPPDRNEVYITEIFDAKAKFDLLKNKVSLVRDFTKAKRAILKKERKH